MSARRHSPAATWQIDSNPGVVMVTVLLISAVLLSFPAWGEMSHYATLDVPGAARTIAFDVNAAGDVVGVYNATCTGSTCSAARGFLWRSGAAVPESVDVPGASMTRVFFPIVCFASRPTKAIRPLITAMSVSGMISPD